MVAVRHSRAINGKCFRSSPPAARPRFCSARSQLLMLLPEQGSTARGERLSYGLPHGPRPEERATCSQQLKCPSWLLPFTEQQTALVLLTCSQHGRTSEKPGERQKYPLLFAAHFAASEAGFRGRMTNS